ncbi:MAG: hypothetical protein J2P48_17895 [Alphaproteobacteria bacterium]|nr:hypothetical protein [Alphaproteobacteria bacterium]
MRVVYPEAYPPFARRRRRSAYAAAIDACASREHDELGAKAACPGTRKGEIAKDREMEQLEEFPIAEATIVRQRIGGR